MKILYLVIVLTAIAAFIKIGLGITEAKRLTELQKTQHSLVQLVAFLNHQKVTDPNREVAQAIEDFRRLVAPGNDHFLQDLQIREIPVSEQIEELRNVSYYVKAKGGGVLTNGLAFRPPFDALALAQRNHLKQRF